MYRKYVFGEMLSVSRVSPDDFVKDVKPWDVFVWKEFIEKYVVPLKVLGNTISSYFAGDPGAEVAKSLAIVASKVIEIATKVVGSVKEEFTAPSDPIECVRLFIEKVANMFLGVDEGGKHTLFAWSLRRITNEYFEVLYPTLAKDNEKKSNVFRILGVKELFKPPIKSPISENLTVLGYPDYPPHGTIVSWGSRIKIRILPPQERTLGGAINRLIDAIVAVLARPGILSVAEPTADVVSIYLKNIPQSSLELDELCGMRVRWVEVPKLLSDYNEFEQDYAWVIRGLELRCADAIYPDKEELIRNSTNILNFFRTTMPAIITGGADLLFTLEGRVIIPFIRVWP
jgi:hypothetical protein